VPLRTAEPRRAVELVRGAVLKGEAERQARRLVATVSDPTRVATLRDQSVNVFCGLKTCTSTGAASFLNASALLGSPTTNP